jgi:hypothetical protein
MKYFALLGALLIAVGCGGSGGHGTAFVPSDGGSGGSSGRTAGHAGGSGKSGAGGNSSFGDGGEGGAESVDPLAPLVTITSPTEVSDPNKGPVILDKVRVLCTATKSGAAGATFSSSTVSIEAFDSGGKSIQKIAGTQNIEDATQFFADFNLSPTLVPNGAISFKCSASDMSSPALEGSAEVKTFIDHGPTIAVTTPALPDPKSGSLDYYALSTAVPFRFTVTPAPLSDGDTQAAVDEVTLTVDSQIIDLSTAEDPKKPGSYQVDIKLNDTSLFKTTPSGAVAVRITASNKRTSLPSDHTGPLTATLEYNFGIDGTGPVVTIISPSPLNAPVVGVSVKIQFTVTDAESGEDPSTVSITLNNGDTKVYDPGSVSWTRNVDTYTYTVANTTLLNGSKIQLTVTVNAKDNSKNLSLPTTAQYWLDTTPPIVDLDPPPMEEIRPTGTGSAYYCSDKFDVLGPASPSDGDTLPSADIVRALVWDVTNFTSGEPVLHYAGIDPTSVRLYAQDNPAQPLLIDLNGDGICDALATEGTQGVLDPPVPFQLDALDAVGSANYTTTSPVIAGVCADVTTNVTPPPKLCPPDDNSDMTRVIDHAISGTKEDVIYTVTSSAADECTGKAVDLGGNLAAGWVCLAAEADDRAGNHGISAPIIVCLTSDSNPTPACAVSSVAKPSCVSNCTPPGHFDANTVLVRPN